MARLGHRFRHRFHLARHLSTDAGGESEYSEPEPHRCRYQGTTRRVVDAEGEVRVASAQMFCDVEVTTLDRVYPPGADVEDYSAGRRPLSVTPRYDMAGALDHYEVWL